MYGVTVNSLEGDLLVLESRLAVSNALLELEHLDLAGLDLHSI